MKKKLTNQKSPRHFKEKQICKCYQTWTIKKLHQKNVQLTINLVNKLIFNPVCAQKITKIIQKQPSQQLLNYCQIQKDNTGQQHMNKFYSFAEIKSVISDVINLRLVKNVYRFVDFKLQHYIITNRYVLSLEKLFNINKERYHYLEKGDSKMSTKSGQNKILKDLYEQENKKKTKVIRKKKKKTSQKVQLQILTQNIQEMIRNIQDKRKLQIFKIQMQNKRIFNTYKLKNMFQKSREQQFKRNMDKDILRLQNRKSTKKKSSGKMVEKIPTERLQKNSDQQFQQYGLSMIRQSKYKVNNLNKKKSKSRQLIQDKHLFKQNSLNKSSKKLSSHRLNTERSQISKEKYSRMHTQYDNTVILKANKQRQKLKNAYSPCFNNIKSKSKHKGNFSQGKVKQKLSLKLNFHKK